MSSYRFLALSLVSLVCAPDLSGAPKKETRSENVFTAFTGKVKGSRVRLRTAPNTDSTIVDELSHGELLAIVGQSNDFYIVEPRDNTKLYVFRTFVLDNAIEGSRVNLRLAPHLDSPVVTQLNTGDKIEIIPSSEQSKWLAIKPPSNIKFYVAKSYITEEGPISLVSEIAARKKKSENLLEEFTAVLEDQSQRAAQSIPYKTLEEKYHYLVETAEGFPQYVEAADAQWKRFKESYFAKQLDFLNDKLEAATATTEPPKKIDLTWEQKENELFSAWQAENPDKTRADFDFEQNNLSLTLTGTLEPFTKHVKNRPGDYLLRVDNKPVAYLYSTQVDLEKNVGKAVTLKAVDRDNHFFAFPAYKVVELQPN